MGRIVAPAECENSIMADVSVRIATEADAPAVGRLGESLVQQHAAFDARRFVWPDDSSTYAEFLRREMHDDNAVVLVAERDGRIVGYVFASIEPASLKELRAASGFVHDIVVEEHQRHASVGTRLITAAIDWLRGQGAVRVMLWSATQNAAAQRLFARLGFRPTMVEMTKELSEP